MKLDLILENVKNKYTLDLLEESDGSEIQTLKSKILINESLSNIRHMLVEEGTMVGVQQVLEEAWTNALFEEAFTGTQREIFDKTNSGTEKIFGVTAGVPIVGAIPSTVSQMVAGYRVGDKLGHPVAGTILGRSGALGATSAEDGSQLNVGNAYTPSNITNKLLTGGSIGTVTGAMMGGIPGAILGGAVGATSNAVIMPGVQYGLGKVFSGQKTTSIK